MSKDDCCFSWVVVWKVVLNVAPFKGVPGLLVAVVLSFSLTTVLQAAVDPYVFERAEQQQRYNHFIKVLRCPQCQNQNLEGSNSAISQDLRRELYRLIIEGKSDAEITEFMQARYGNFILYDTPLDSSTIVLWVAPLLMLIIGLFLLWRLVRTSQSAKGGSSALTEQQRARARAMLNDDDGEQK